MTDPCGCDPCGRLLTVPDPGTDPTCGCCGGVQRITPVPVVNRPGLPALAYRVGTHATFLETMKARLSGISVDVPIGDRSGTMQSVYPLRRLTTRDSRDPAIALLDAWATIGDVLTFYQERIANEGYLGTATERRSVLELARLVGYTLRPGVAASVHLSFLLETGYAVEIPAGTRAQTLPGPGELPQSFETSGPIAARAAWNNLRPRLTRPQKITCDDDPTTGAGRITTLYVHGTSANLKPNDLLLIVCGTGRGQQVLRTVLSVRLQPEDDRTEVALQPEIAAEIIPPEASALMRLVNDYIAEAAASFPGSELAKRVVAALQGVRDGLASATPTGVLELIRRALVAIREIQRIAVMRRYSRLEPWIAGLVVKLERIAAPPAPSTTGTAAPTQGNGAPPALSALAPLLEPLSRPPSLHPATEFALARSVRGAFGAEADAAPRLLSTLRPALNAGLFQAWRGVTTPPGPVEVYVLRTKASLFGHNAPKKPEYNERGQIIALHEWPIVEGADFAALAGLPRRIKHEDPDAVTLDGSFDGIVASSWVVVDTSAVNANPDDPMGTTLVKPQRLIAKARQVNASLSRADYGISGTVTRITLGTPADSRVDALWIAANLDDPNLQTRPEDFQIVRRTTVYAQSEKLALAEEPIDDDVQGARIELGALYDGLDAGRWVVVAGERTDVGDIAGVRAAEVSMVAGVAHGIHPALPGDAPRTTLMLATPLAYSYDPASVTIYGNVAPATHGESRTEVLGSGDAGKALQQFTLRQSPVTHVAAVTPTGTASSLRVRVNEVLWHEAPGLAGLGPTDRRYATQRDDAEKTSVIGGTGQQGARFPTGQENVTSTYRTGIGKAGNAKGEQISLLATRPLGVKSVINPLPATGGADPDTRDAARRNAPLAVAALDRLVSIQDYADFALTFAGIGKASAARLSDGRRQVVHVTIAGVDDIPISPTSDLYRSLLQALHAFGDPFLPVELAVRNLKLLVIVAAVRVLPDYRWEAVAPALRAALLDAFGFSKRELGQDAVLSEAEAMIQSVAGVAYVDMKVFDAVPQGATLDQLAGLGQSLTLRTRVRAGLATLNPFAAAGTGDRILPADLAIVSPDVPDTLILTELTG